MAKYNFSVLIPNTMPNGEAEKAEALFKQFLASGFIYDEISSHPDWPVYASAEMLHLMLPWMIDEMLKRNDTGNFLIYPMITAVDPENEISDRLRSRARKVLELSDTAFAHKVLDFLAAVREDPPNSEEQIERLIALWQRKVQEGSNHSK